MLPPDVLGMDSSFLRSVATICGTFAPAFWETVLANPELSSKSTMARWIVVN
jgi:hypothetical protein